ncbi:MAG: putative 4-hydroxybenzoate polyprenyltransferase [Gemmatales bacterium]|nr:putative 4-hydroxybenzoate polyprenyltransferase [Gemmatales bacterium]MDW8388279.1 UbiA-like polyprenyltransferase [Gemmatales bacterium]
MSATSSTQPRKSLIGLVSDFLGMIRFSHTLFALPFALAALVLAWQKTDRLHWPEWALDLAGIVVCMVLARSTAMGFNRLVDHRYDASNPRTANRHLPTGRLSRTAVWGFTLLCGLGFVVSTFHFVLHNDNWWPVYLSVPVLLFICAYSLTKRFTSLSHFWLGASLMLAPVATWLAITGGLALAPMLLGLAVLCWVAGFDIIYACQDVDFDRKAGLHSVPARLGVSNALRVSMLCHLVMLGLLVGVGIAAELGWVYYVGIGIIAGLLVYEHWLVRPDDLSRVNAAFFHVNAVISVGLFVLIVADVWLVR